MTYDEARRMVVERSQAVGGDKPDADAEPTMVTLPATGDEVARLILLGSLEGEELDKTVQGMCNCAINALMGMEGRDVPSAHATLMVLFTQTLLHGLLMGRGRS